MNWVDTSSKKVREAYNQWWVDHSAHLEDTFKRSGVDMASVATGEDYVKPLMHLFKRRGA
jgi:hypothetical protein